MIHRTARIAVAAVAALLPSAPQRAAGERHPAIPAAAGPAAEKERAAANRYAPGCVIAMPGHREGTMRYFASAGLQVSNMSGRRVIIGLESRMGAGMPETMIGTLEPGAAGFFPNVLPVGRNILFARPTADERAPGLRRQPAYIWNHGPLTCSRKFRWEIR